MSALHRHFLQNLPYSHLDCLENLSIPFDMSIQKVEYNPCSVAIQIQALGGAGGEHSGAVLLPVPM